MQGALVGVMRRTRGLYKFEGAHGVRPDVGWQIDIEGALGEMAWAKASNMYWSGAKGYRERGKIISDVNNDEVRTTPLSYGRLILHEKDSDHKAFILLTGSDGNYIIRGYIKGINGKREKFWKDPVGGRPAYFVPQYELNPIHELFDKEETIQEQGLPQVREDKSMLNL